MSVPPVVDTNAVGPIPVDAAGTGPAGPDGGGETDTIGRRRVTTTIWLPAAAGGLLIGVAALSAVLQGSLLPALFAVPYVAFLCAVWWGTRGDLAALVVSAYLVAPPPADNLMPQVEIFGSQDLGLTGRDLALLADVVLLVALLVARPGWPRGRLAGLYLGGLALLAVYPLVVGLVAGAGQSVPALLQGMAMPLRGLGVIVLLVWWARRRGWAATLTTVARAIVLSGVAVSLVALVFVVLARGEVTLTLLGYAAVVDGRPSVPGWGNNIMGNFLATGCAVLVFTRHRLGWRLRWVVLAALGLLIGIVLTELRTSLLVALAVVEAPVVIAVLQRVWPRRGSLRALLAGGGSGVGLVLFTALVLPLLNPRYLTLLPAAIRPYWPDQGMFGGDLTTTAAGDVIDATTGVDQGGQSVSTRAGLLRAALEVWERNPILGTGWNGWGWAKRETTVSQLVAVDPHNGITWLLADAGLLGVILLYAIPVLLAWRRPDLWWLFAAPAVATMLEMVNPNLRNAHFSVAIWAFLALVLAAGADGPRYRVREWLADTWDWVRGRPRRSGARLDADGHLRRP